MECLENGFLDMKAEDRDFDDGRFIWLEFSICLETDGRGAASSGVCCKAMTSTGAAVSPEAGFSCTGLLFTFRSSTSGTSAPSKCFAHSLVL